MHALDFTTGKAGIAFVGKTPWHGYGQELQPEAPLDDWRIAAGLDWDVVERPVYYAGEGSGVIQIPERKALVRSDTQHYLSTVSDRYKPVQPAAVLEFYRELIERNGFRMHTAGSLKDGRRIWALAEIGESTTLYGQDRIEGFLLLATSYDASMATTARFTSVRVVCNNTLEVAYGDNRNVVSVPHTADFDPNAVKGELGLTHEAWAAFNENAQRLAERTVSREEVIEYFYDLLELQDKDLTNKDLMTGRKGSQLRTLLKVYEEAPGQNLRSAKGTAWGLVNAVTYYQDHQARAANAGARVDSAWFGAGSQRKARALEAALKLAA